MNHLKFAVACRALAVHEGQLLVTQQRHGYDFYALPGGKLYPGEGLEACLARELLEETGVTAKVGPLLIVNEWIGTRDHRLEFFFWVNNAADFRDAKIANASHGFELAELKFIDPLHADQPLKPLYLADVYPELLKLGPMFPLRRLKSNS